MIVLDVNVYLDVAELVGSPFDWGRFNDLVVATREEPVPCKSEPAYDCLKVVAMCMSGRFAGEDPVEVWTNDHIQGLVKNKAVHPVEPDPVTGLRGLGWSPDDADSLAEDLVGGLIEKSNGGCLPVGGYPDGNPPLDHEDGMVYGACHDLATDDLLCNVFCVTRDRGFLDAARNGELQAHTRVVTPAQMVALMRHARFRLSTAAMRRKS